MKISLVCFLLVSASCINSDSTEGLFLSGAGKVLYIDVTSGSDQNTGTSASPFKTLQAALDKVTSGGTINILPGTYEIPEGLQLPSDLENFSIVGNRGYTNSLSQNTKKLLNFLKNSDTSGRIAFEKSFSEKPVVFIPKSSSQHVILEITNTSNLTIDGIVFDATNAINAINFVNTNDYSGPTGNSISNSVLKNAPNMGIIFEGATLKQNLFANNIVYNNGFTCTGAGFHKGICHGVYVSAPNTQITGNTVFYNGGWGIHVYSGSKVFVNNILINENTLFENGLQNTVKYIGPAIGVYSGSGSRIQDNIIHDSKFGIEVAYDAQSVSIERNTLKNIQSSGIRIGTGCNHGIIESITIADNTFESILNSPSPGQNQAGIVLNSNTEFINIINNDFSKIGNALTLWKRFHSCSNGEINFSNYRSDKIKLHIETVSGDCIDRDVVNIFLPKKVDVTSNNPTCCAANFDSDSVCSALN